MNERQEFTESYSSTPPALGIKRYWDSADPWSGFNEDSTATNAGSPKRPCFSWPTTLEASEAPYLAEPAVWPSISSHALGYEGTPSMEPAISGFDMFSSNHLQPLMNPVGLSTQQWEQHSNGGWQFFNSTDNTSTTRPVINYATPQLPTDWTSWLPSEPNRYDYFVPTDNSATLGSYNHDAIVNDGVGLGDSDHFGSEKPSQDDEEGLDATPSTAPTSEPQDSICLNEDLYDSCFGVIVLENFQLQNEFFSGKVAKDVSLEVNGSLVIIKDAISDKYGGILDQSAARIVIKLVNDCNVKLSASIKTQNKIEVLIYGWLKESDSIGDLLLDLDCFLQQPDSYDATRPYHNPQYLLHPDKEDETSWEYKEVSSAQLGENEKSKVAELLDSATGPSTFRRVEISNILVTELKDHQKKALSMMIEKETGCTRGAEFSSVWVENSETDPSWAKFRNTVTQVYVAQTPRLCLGGLLADDMGLGKTLTTLALIATTFTDGVENSEVPRATLIICPVTTITGWQDQIERHFKKESLTCRIYHGSTRDDNATVMKSADIVITSYETLRLELPDDEAEQKEVRGFRRSGILHSIDWHRVVLDEAHIVRNRTSKTFRAVKALKARHRWCLTGTPIQNRLDDLGSLVEFLRIDPFDDPSVFKNTFLVPINDGHSAGWERLRLLIKAIALRRTKTALNNDLNLPPRQEKTQEVHLDDEEKATYDLVKRYFMRIIDSNGSAMNTFQLILRLRQICNHKDLLPQHVQTWLSQALELGDSVLPQLQSCETCGIALDDDESSSRVFSCFHQICRACLQNRDSPDGDFNSLCPLCDTNHLGKAREMCTNLTVAPKHGFIHYRPSSKIKALLHNLRMDHGGLITPDKPLNKSVVFSTWTGMLDLIGKALSANDFIYERLDGSMSLAQRRSALDNFRSNPDCTVLLASLGSAAVGLDLTMASRVHLMEPGWNPLLEQQAIDRVHRLGQESQVIATHYVVSGVDSIEQYVQQRQVWKMNLIPSSLDDSMAHKNEAIAISRDFMRNILTGTIG